MEMTIKEAIPILHDMYNYYNDVDVDAYVGFDKEDNNAIEIALDTMRKYQKIEQILDDCDLEAWEVLEKVKEVVRGEEL